MRLLTFICLGMRLAHVDGMYEPMEWYSLMAVM